MYLEWIGTLGSVGIVARILEFLSSFKLRVPPLRCDRNAGIPFPKKQRNEPSSRHKEGKMGLLLSFAGPLVFLSSGIGYVGELLELHQGCQRPL